MKIILASQSARRQELLKTCFKDLVVKPSFIVEKTDQGGSPEVEVMSLAHQKAFDVAKLHKEDLVIGSDTIVYLDTIIGKPQDEDDAFQIIKHLQGRTHQVYTAISLICLESNYKVVDYDTTDVTFKTVSDEEIRDYLQRTHVLDKAGAYAIQEEGHELVKGYSGELTTIIGFPMPLFKRMYQQFQSRNKRHP